MENKLCCCSFPTCCVGLCECALCELYPVLRCRVGAYVYRSSVPRWRGQEDDVIDDLVQDGMLRILGYMEQASRGEVLPVRDLKAFGVTVVIRLCHDLRRKELRFIRFSHTDEEFSPFEGAIRDTTFDLEEEALNNLTQATDIMDAIQIIVAFPPKQRTALLIYLSGEDCFDSEPSLVYHTFLAYGIDLKDYQLPLPLDAIGRSRHAALLCTAKKRLRTLFHQANGDGDLAA